MDVRFFLNRRLGFIRQLYGTASAPYVERKQKIEDEEAYGSPIFKAVRQKRRKALYTPLRRSPKLPECVVGAGSEGTNVWTSAAAPQ